MKKKLSLLILTLIFLTSSNVLGVNFGSYKTDYEYGLFDSLKFNWKNREKGQSFIELKSETQEGREYLERNTKEYENARLDENQQYRMLRENTVVY